MMRSSLCLAALGVGLMTTGASAQPLTSNGLYVGASVADAIFYDVEADDGSDVDIDSEYIFRGQVGYRFGSWRAETEFAYQSAEAEDVDDDEFDVTIIRGAVSLFYDFAPIAILDQPSPYVGGGIGIANTEFEGTDGNDFEDDETGVTFHGEVGLTFHLTERFALMPQYRIEWIDSNEVADIQDDLYSHAFGVGGRFYF